MSNNENPSKGNGGGFQQWMIDAIKRDGIAIDCPVCKKPYESHSVFLDRFKDAPGEVYLNSCPDCYTAFRLEVIREY